MKILQEYFLTNKSLNVLCVAFDMNNFFKWEIAHTSLAGISYFKIRFRPS